MWGDSGAVRKLWFQLVPISARRQLSHAMTNVEFSPLAEAPKEWRFDLAPRIWKLLSVAAGTVIEWIIAAGANECDERTRSVHAARRTRPYCSLPVAPIKEFGHEANHTAFRCVWLERNRPSQGGCK